MKHANEGFSIQLFILYENIRKIINFKSKIVIDIESMEECVNKRKAQANKG